MKQMPQRILNTAEIVSACYYLYTSHNHHPLTGTPFSENNTAIPTTPATLTTLTTPASVPAANLASSPAIPTTPATPTTLTTPASNPTANLASSPAIPTTPATPTTLATGDHPAANLAHLTCNPRYSHYSRYSYYWGPFRLKLSPSTHHPRAQYSDSIVTLRCAQDLSPWAERSFAAAQHDSAIPYYCPLAIEPYWRHVPVYDTLNNSLKYIKASSTMMPSPDCRILSTGEIWEEFCNSTEAIVPYKQRQSLCCLSFTGFAYIAFPPEMQYTQNL
ncbi:MAG: hypothetical protein ACJ8DI_03280 [Ktedonobacteraceae bacterium]